MTETSKFSAKAICDQELSQSIIFQQVYGDKDEIDYSSPVSGEMNEIDRDALSASYCEVQA